MRHNERGIALPLALLVLIVVGALVAGSFSVSRLEQQSGRNTLFAVQARATAEGGLEDALASLEPAALEAMSVGGAPVSLPLLSLHGGVVARDVRRLTTTLFLIRAQGRRLTPDAGVLATRSLGALIRLVSAEGADSKPEPQLVERGWLSLD